MQNRTDEFWSVPESGLLEKLGTSPHYRAREEYICVFPLLEPLRYIPARAGTVLYIKGSP